VSALALPDANNLRRQFRLPAEDEAFLDALGLVWETVTVANQQWLLVYAEKVPAGYNTGEVDVAILIAPGYPPGKLDMAYFFPPLMRANGRAPERSDSRVTIDGKAWQGWSRHRTDDNPWVPGEDSLESHYFYMRAWLADELKR
jgi:Prokaryotic E2 family E